MITSCCAFPPYYSSATILQWRQLVSDSLVVNDVTPGRLLFTVYVLGHATGRDDGVLSRNRTQVYRVACCHQLMYLAYLRGPHSVGPFVRH